MLKKIHIRAWFLPKLEYHRSIECLRAKMDSVSLLFSTIRPYTFRFELGTHWHALG